MPSKKPQETVIEKILSFFDKNGITIIIDADSREDSVRMGLPFTYEKKDRVLTIFLNNLENSEKLLLLPAVHSFFYKHGLVLDIKQEELLSSYKDYESNNPYAVIIEAFKDRISSNDLDALKMSLYMRWLKDNGEKYVERYKLDIRERFGSRGAYIANLVNAGYFENDLFEAANSMAFEDFERHYKQSVGEESIALFVHRGLTPSFMRKAIEDKIEKCRKYSRETFRIMGYGKDNVDFIKFFLSNNPDESWGPDIKIRVRDGRDSASEIEFEVYLS